MTAAKDRIRRIPFTVKMAAAGLLAGLAVAFSVGTGIYNLVQLSEKIQHQNYERCLQINSAHDQSVRYIHKVAAGQIAAAKKTGKYNKAFQKQEDLGVREYYVLFGLEFPKRDCKHLTTD